MGEVFRAFRDDPELRVAIVTGGGDKILLRRLGSEGRGGGGGGRCGLRRRRVRRPAGAARPQQAGDRRGERHGGRRRLGAGAFRRPDPGGRARPLRAAGDPRRHARRRRDRKTAEAHPLSRRHGHAFDRALDGGFRGASLGARQRGAAGGAADGARLGDRAAARKRPAARLRRHQGGGARRRGGGFPDRDEQDRAAAISDGRRSLRQRGPERGGAGFRGKARAGVEGEGRLRCVFSFSSTSTASIPASCENSSPRTAWRGMPSSSMPASRFRRSRITTRCGSWAGRWTCGTSRSIRGSSRRSGPSGAGCASSSGRFSGCASATSFWRMRSAAPAGRSGRRRSACSTSS